MAKQLLISPWVRGIVVGVVIGGMLIAFFRFTST